jgi:NADPH:quinone reductase-like Zn-dependent oxidoreductase
MKAIRFNQFGGPEVLEIVELPDPHPGPGQVRIAVRAAGVNPSDWKKRKGLMDRELPQTMGHEAAGVVDELGDDVADVAVGDRVFGFSAEAAAQAELAVLTYYAPIPPSLDFPGAAALPAAIETATRALDQLGAGSGSTLLINGASGSAAVQLAMLRGSRVIGTVSSGNHEYLRSLGAEPVAYGEGLVRALLAPGRADLPARRSCRGSPGQRAGPRAREARAAGRLSANAVLRASVLARTLTANCIQCC